ncbi:TolC family protein [Sandaracinobacter neustonicus]|jgi:cobalt-zinc-cadmium efflux system outer membrane protein|uniref:TolC family protein n=1 Tax=Sandaracinobacter neustonicus TaxID=1715348 RepID=A0A501XKN7_9SPHN|nr:TolC family protein [Sandaracinobacter neustonicus]
MLVLWRRRCVVYFACLWLPATAIAAQSPLTLADAVREARLRSPLGVETSARIEAEQGRLAQAKLRPNPELDISVENFAGSRDYSGTRSAETTGSLALPVELGGKRSARVGAAMAGVAMAEAEAGMALLDLDLAVREAHTLAAEAEAEALLAAEDAAIARELDEAVGKLVRAGREPPLRQVTAAAERAQAEAAVELASAERLGARERLAALIGRDRADFEVPPLAPAQKLETSGQKLAAGPDMTAAQVQVDLSRARLREAKSQAVPDVRFSLGARRLASDDATAMVAGVSIPFPLFNRNGGNIAAASAEVRGAQAAASRLERQANARLVAAEARVRGAWASFQTYDRVVVPGAAEALRIARLGYAAGRFPYSDLLMAQRGYAEARRARLSAARDAELASAERDRAAGLYPFGDAQ